MGRFVILSGPSCVGKGPLIASFRKFFPELVEKWSTVILFNSRSPRPGETDGVDYHFRSRTEIEKLRNDEKYRVFKVRGDIQALDVVEISRMTGSGVSFFEGNPFVGTALIDIAESLEISILSIFLSPLSRKEILFIREKGVDLEKFTADVMRRKLLRRTIVQKGNLSMIDLEDIEKRCNSAYGEIRYAPLFQYVIPNHDGEDSENWKGFYYPIGDAARTLFSFCNLVNGIQDDYSEKWEPELFQEGD